MTGKECSQNNLGNILQDWGKNIVPIRQIPGLGIVDNLNEAFKGISRGEDGQIQINRDNFPILIGAVVAGNPEAQDTFYAYWGRRLLRFFSSRDRDAAEDLTQDALVKIAHALPVFENKGRGDYFANLHHYCYAIARYTFYDYLGTQRKHPRTTELTGREIIPEEYTPALEEQDKSYPSVNWDMFREKVRQTLPELQGNIAEAMLSGKTNEAVMLEFGIGRTKLRVENRRMRRTIEEQLLLPAGLKPLDSPDFSAMTEKQLQDGARRGKLGAIKILRFWYTTDELFRFYQWSRRPQLDEERPYPTPYRQRQRSKVKNLAEEGSTISEIAAAIERSISTVKTILAEIRKEGEIVRIRKRYKRTKKDLKEFDLQVLALRKGGKTNDQIAFKLNVSLSSVTRSVDRLLKKGEIDFRRPFGR